jgi:hypothetical protein
MRTRDDPWAGLRDLSLRIRDVASSEAGPCLPWRAWETPGHRAFSERWRGLPMRVLRACNGPADYETEEVMSKRNIRVVPAGIERDVYLPPIYLADPAERVPLALRLVDFEVGFGVGRRM